MEQDQEGEEQAGDAQKHLQRELEDLHGGRHLSGDRSDRTRVKYNEPPSGDANGPALA
ncbi:hypothetical protein GCM10017586_04980 [Microbacterium imperiale]|uniref:Uncharacterized protein n=1 Tax=Microbacterium imperiale TaxID=33884 RepID=A0A9W6HE43_9MICO|nr:hypothetical protein GCM10017586_04980 [Microbacterium imperiale]